MISALKTRFPLIGITADISASRSNRPQLDGEPTHFLHERYTRAVHRARGFPVILPTTTNSSILRQTAATLDGLIISGGGFDIHPKYYGEKPIVTLGQIKSQRTECELALVELALKLDTPILGICGGAQAINVVLGGSLYQDIRIQIPGAAEHQCGNETHRGHLINIRPRTQLRTLIKRNTLAVNSTHHQAIKTLGKGLVINATAQDGLIEGIESEKHSFVLGVQWHPESLSARDPLQQRIFSAFIVACSRQRLRL